jgi:L-asparaginase
MDEIVVINTGGTFNKTYNPITGRLEVTHDALLTLQKVWHAHFETIHIIHKDSLEMTKQDREEIRQTITNHPAQKFLIIHGTDTMNETAQFLDEQVTDKTIVLTGAMVPFSIDATEASSNFGFAFGFLQIKQEHGTYIAIHGLADHHIYIVKNREEGYFTHISTYTLKTD